MLTPRGHFMIQGRLRTDTARPTDFWRGTIIGWEAAPSPERATVGPGLTQQSHTTSNARMLLR